MKKTLLLTLASVALAASAFAAVASGLKPGNQISPFHPKHVSGPLAGTDKCFPCTYQSRPQLMVFVNGDDAANVQAIAKALDGAMGKYEGKEFKAMIVLLTNGTNDAAVKTAAETAAKNGKLNRVAMAVLPITHEAVKAYQINTGKDVRNTVIAYEGWKVTHNMVNLKADEKGTAALNAAISELVK